jgi:hypothetical protein
MRRALSSKGAGALQPVSGAFTSPLWSSLANTEKLPTVVASLGAVLLAGRLYAHLSSAPAVICVLLAVGSALFGRWHYRRNRRSVRAILLFFQLTGWPLAVSFGFVSIGVSYLTGSIRYYSDHWPAFLGAYLSVLCALAVYFAAWQPTFPRQYVVLASYRAMGSICADEFYQVLISGQSTQLTSRLPVFVGMSVPVFMVIGIGISGVLHRDVREVLGVLLLAAVSVTVASVLAARLWLQYKYLGGDDLLVAD